MLSVSGWRFASWPAVFGIGGETRITVLRGRDTAAGSARALHSRLVEVLRAVACVKAGGAEA